MKLSTRLSLAMGTLILFIVLIGGFGLYQMQKINRASTIIATQWLPATVAIEEMNVLFSDYRIQQIQHVFSTEAKAMQDYEVRMEGISKRFNDRMKTYESIPMNAEIKKMYDTYIELRNQYSKVHDKFIGLSRDNKTDQAIAILNGEGREVYNAASAALEKIVAQNVQGASTASLEGDASVATAFTTIIGLLIVSILTAIVVAIYIIRNTLQTLGKDPGELSILAQRVSSDDFDIDDGSPRIGVYGHIIGMVAALKQHIEKAHTESEHARAESLKATDAMQRAELASNDAQAKTKTMLQAADRLEQVGAVVSSASTQLSAQIEQSERGASEQAARVSETATAVEEMNSTVLEVARNAGNAANISTQTKAKAEEGARVVQNVVTAIGNVQKDSLALKDDMATLTQHAQNISQIMGVISDIADQTNLLALNAAIEAARAGEAGRGFAVVADEVRKLAEKTMASTTDVGNAIRSIQQSAEASSKQVDSTVHNVETATELAGQCGAALNEIVSLADGTADQVRAIATASEQQSSTSEEIARSMGQVSTIAGETARAMQEAAQAVSDMANQAQVLTGLIGDMKRG